MLRIGVAFAFLYPALRAIFDPVSWLSYFPNFIRDVPIDSLILLHGFGAVEVAIALWLLSGWKILTPALLAALMLVGIVAFNTADMDVVFRDLSIAIMAFALVLWPKAQVSAAPSVPPAQPPLPHEDREGQG